MLATPCCDVGAQVQSNGICRCSKCGYSFPIKDAVMRERKPTRRSKKTTRPERYRGAKAGPIIYPGFVYGATRLG